MAIKLDYVVRETAINLKRNLSLTVASILTVAVSLSLVGAALLLNHGIENATIRWRGDIEFIVFMQPQAAQAQIDSVRRDLEDHPEVREFRFVDKQAAYEEFQVLFRNDPTLVELTTPDVLPTSFRVVPRDADPSIIDAVGRQFERKPGVDQVAYARDAVESVLRLTRFLQVGIVATAVVSLVAAALLILNTIRMAMFARRREIEVMKLVGATNWFIRIPFMLEGLVQGLIGALIAWGSVVVLNNVFEDVVSEGSGLTLFENFSVAPGEVQSTGLLLILVGINVGAIGSGLAVSRFLDV